MPNSIPILFNRWVEVPAGTEQFEPLTLSNTFHEIGFLELSTLDERYEDDWKAVPFTRPVEVDTNDEKRLRLRHPVPPESAPGLHPFTLAAHLHPRRLGLRLPGLTRASPPTTSGPLHSSPPAPPRLPRASRTSCAPDSLPWSCTSSSPTAAATGSTWSSRWRTK